MSTDEAEPIVTGARTAGAEWFEGSHSGELRRLRVALVGAYGAEVGAEAAADAEAYAWEHRERLAEMANPVGYLFRVGQSASRRHRRWSKRLVLPPVPPALDDEVHPDLPVALARLTDRQRIAVVLVHVHGWTQDEAAQALGVDASTVRTHVARGLARLRDILGEDYR